MTKLRCRIAFSRVACKYLATRIRIAHKKEQTLLNRDSHWGTHTSKLLQIYSHTLYSRYQTAVLLHYSFSA
jgi:hypothetical protein